MTPRFLALACVVLCACSSTSDPSTPGTDASTDKDTSVDTGGSIDTGTPDTASCGTGETLCSGACVKTSSDPAHCGKCGNACGTGETCSGGACACDTGKTKCSSGCADTKTDTANCGTCGKACGTGETCSDGKCYPPCPTGQTRCSGTCVDTNADTNNCGTCGTKCATTEACNAGTCGIKCDYPTKACSGVCVNVDFDANNCGACGKKCDSGPNGTAGCTSSSCVFTCSTGYGNCDDKASNGCEIDLKSDDKNCGTCGKACTAYETCLSSKCECKTGNLRCPAVTGACTDVTSDPANCGACAKVCATNETCSSSACVCKTGFTRCPATTGACTDMKVDKQNCGACGTICPGTSTCSDGKCCPAGQINCGGTCVDPKADPLNCGGCGKACDTTTPYCAAGTCGTTCGTLTACGYSCTDTTNDVKNCGMCSKACLTGETCLSSSCVQLGFPGSKIIDATQGSKINTWIGTPGQLWKTCYVKPSTGASASAFHTACDGKGPSVTIARLNTAGVIRVVGGYNTTSWSAAGTYSGTSTGFLFSITNDFKHDTPGTSSGAYWTYNSSTYGPTFGGGHDWYTDSALTSGYCNIGYNYKCRTGMGAYGSATCKVDFCGSSATSSGVSGSFTIEALEVWVK